MTEPSQTPRPADGSLAEDRPGSANPVQDGQTRRIAALLTVLWVCAALLGGLVWIFAHPETEALGRNPVAVLLLGVAFVGVALLGRGSFREAWGRRPSTVWLAVAPLTGVLILAVSVAWVRFVRDDAIFASRELGSIGMLIATTALVAYTEEFLFRGVLWAALVRRSRGLLLPIAQTSMLFAIAHIFGAGTLAEIPHRLVAGVVLALLRASSGSLWPCLHVHFFVNLSVHIAF